MKNFLSGEKIHRTKSGRDLPVWELRREKAKKRIDQIRDFLVFFIPIDIPKPVQLACGVFNVMLLLTIFVCLFYFGFTNVMSTVYLSPVHSSEASQYCELIAQTNSGDYLGTAAGVWEGNAKFVYSSAIYRITLTSYTATQQQYQVAMEKIYSNLQYLGGVMAKSDLSKNVMVWMSLVFANSSAAAQRFSLTGTPDSVFNRQFFDADLGTVNGRCNVSSTTTYDRSSHIVRSTFDIHDFNNDPYCVEAVNTTRFGYNYLNKPSNFDIKFDMRTLITAAAINYGLLAVRSLTIVPTQTISFDINGTAYQMTWIYDPKYPGMDPIYCTLPGAYGFSHPVCIMTIADAPVYPFLIHTGKDLSYPAPCLCTTLTTDDLFNPNHHCHIFDFQAGFVFWNTPSLAPYYEFAFLMASQAYYLDRSFYAASLVMNYWSRQAAYTTKFKNIAFRRQAFSFCKTVSAGYCSIYLVRTYDLAKTFQSSAVSPYYFQLDRGACRDSITPTQENWKMLIETPFAPITQQYQECTYALSYAIENETGTALGNMSIFTPACILVIYVLVYLYKQSGLYQPPVHRSYSQRDKHEALDALALSLLMVRDNKFHTRKSIFLSKEAQHLLAKQRQSLTVNHGATPSNSASAAATPLAQDDSYDGTPRTGSIVPSFTFPTAPRPSLTTGIEMRPRAASDASQTAESPTHHGQQGQAASHAARRRSRSSSENDSADATHLKLPVREDAVRQVDSAKADNSTKTATENKEGESSLSRVRPTGLTLSLPLPPNTGNTGNNVHFAPATQDYNRLPQTPTETLEYHDDDEHSYTPRDSMALYHMSDRGSISCSSPNRSRPVSTASKKSSHNPQRLTIIQGIVDELRAHATMSEFYNNEEQLGFLRKRVIQIDGQDVIVEDDDSDFEVYDEYFDNRNSMSVAIRRSDQPGVHFGAQELDAHGERNDIESHNASSLSKVPFDGSASPNTTPAPSALPLRILRPKGYSTRTLPKAPLNSMVNMSPVPLTQSASSEDCHENEEPDEETGGVPPTSPTDGSGHRSGAVAAAPPRRRSNPVNPNLPFDEELDRRLAALAAAFDGPA